MKPDRATAQRPLALVGPTAVGKTEAAVPVAEALGAEILCVDSMLVYRGMDVGTAKPVAEQLRRVPHHLIDVVDPAEGFSVSRYQSLAAHAAADIAGRGRRVLLVGGTGLYFRAVVDRLRFPRTDPEVRRLLEAEASTVGPEALHARLRGLDPAAAGRIEAGNIRRTVRALEVAAVTGQPFSSFARTWDRYPAAAVRAAGIDIPTPLLHARIEGRVQAMMPALLEETARLMARDFEGFLTSTQAIGYAEAVAVLKDQMDVAEAVARTIRRTKALARRQRAWFRRDPRIRWFEAGSGGALESADAIVGYLRGSDETLAREA